MLTLEPKFWQFFTLKLKIFDLYKNQKAKFWPILSLKNQNFDKFQPNPNILTLFKKY